MPSLDDGIPPWVNTLAPFAQDFDPSIALYGKLSSGALNQIEHGDKKISLQGSLGRAGELNQVQQMVCDGSAFMIGFGVGIGAGAGATPESLGIGTIPAFLAARAAGGTLAYNACRLYFDKPLTVGSVAWGAADGLVGGIDRYGLETLGAESFGSITRASLPGAVTYSYANTLSRYWKGEDGLALGFGTNLAFSMVAPIAFIRPARLVIGKLSIDLLTSGSTKVEQTDQSQ